MNLSWIKNQINKFLYKETDDEFEDAEFERFSENKATQYEENHIVQNHSQSSRTAFRFPLIDDVGVAAAEQPKHQRFEQQSNHNYTESAELKLPQYLQKPQTNTVYDVEVSGIRDLLERRRKGRGHSNVIRSQESVNPKMQVTKAEREVLMAKPMREEQKVNKEFASPLANRKRFVPSDVPSPVHGFQRPTPIEALMERQQFEQNEQLHNEDREATSVEMTNNSDAMIADTGILGTTKNEEAIIHPENEVAATKVVVKEIESIQSDVEVADETEEIVVEPNLLANHTSTPHLAVETEEEPFNEMQVKHVTIENSTIHIGQLNVEQMPQAEELQQSEFTTFEAKQVRQSSGSRVPFNVVMLKSDKQKLTARKFLEEQFQQVTITKNVSEPTIQEEKGCVEVSVSPETPIDESCEQSNDLILGPLHEPQEMNLEPLPETVEQPIENEILQEEIELPEQRDEAIYVANEPNDEKVDLNAVSEDIKQAETSELPELPFTENENNVFQEKEPIQEEIEPVQQEEKVKLPPYVKPPLEYLVPPEAMIEDREWMDEQGERLVEALSFFQIQAHIESIVQGPAVTQFEITVGQGTKVSKVRNLADDIKLALAAKDIRIDAPIPGKRSIGIEIPNRISRAVRLSEVTDSDSFRHSDSPLEAALGLDLTGKPVTIDLRKMPHGLIAGATGSGKSVCINSILVSLLYKADPKELKLMLIDPKMVELAPFNHIPHLVSPVITDVKAATAALKWAVEEMERRYQLFMHSGARKIEAYNKMCEENHMYAQKLPYLLIVIDELADLMMMSPQDVEDSICRITQKARAAGIHLIVATQRPSVDVITGLIKSNIPSRIAFSVSSQIDSRTILDSQGAERLLGRGDMLYLGNGMSAPTRIQGTFVTDDEIEEIIEYVRDQGEPEYIFKQEELLKRSEAAEEQDELFEEICRFVFEQGSVSTSLLQRRYHIGYNRAARLVDMLEKQGFVSEPKGSKPRDVFITEEDLAVQFGD